MKIVDFQMGTVVGTNPLAKDASGNDSPSVTVQSQEDGSLIGIPLANTGFFQYIPPVGTKVLFFRLGSHQGRIVQIYGTNADYIRKGRFALQEGEIQIQSPTGLSYLKLDSAGRVRLISADGAVFEHLDDVSQIRAPQIRLITDENTVIEIREDSSVRIERYDDQGTILSSMVMDAQDNIAFEAKNDVTIKAKNIYLDGKTWIGPGASDQIQRNTFGDSMTGGPFGTQPFDSPYGINSGSNNVKVSQ